VSSAAAGTPPSPPASKSSKSATATPRPPKMEITATGTGWYVAPGGYLVTNAHVVEDCKMVTLKSGAELQILNMQPDEDLALLKGVTEVAPLVLRDGRSARLAEDVLIAGYPLGGILSSGINVTVGTVSALAGMGDDERRFQFTAPVQPGNSGGPVLDTSGHVIGVVVSKLNAMSIQDEIGDIPQNAELRHRVAEPDQVPERQVTCPTRHRRRARTSTRLTLPSWRESRPCCCSVISKPPCGRRTSRCSRFLPSPLAARC